MNFSYSVSVFGGGIWGLKRPPSVRIALSQAVVLSHHRRHLQLLRIRHQEAKWHRTSPGVGLCEGSYRRQLSPNARSPADSLAPVSRGEEALWGMGQRVLGDGEDGAGTDPDPSFCPVCPVSLQSYLQSLRERQLGPGSQATAPHTILDLDSDCGSTVPLTTHSGSTQT